MISSDLITNLKLDNKQFIGALDTAQSKVGKFASTATKSMLALSAIVTGTLTVAFSKLTDTIIDTSDEIDKLNDTAIRLNVDFSDLQKLQYVAKLNGSSAEELNSALKRLMRTTSAAADGNKNAVRAFENLGLSIKDIKNLSIDKQFELISQRIQMIPDSAGQAQSAIELFGRSGINLLQLLKSDVQGTKKEFEDLGLGITQSQADAAASFNDSRDKFNAIWENFKQQITVQVVPSLQLIIEWIQKTIKEAGGLQPIANAVAMSFVSGLNYIVQGFQKVIDFIKITKIGILELQQLVSNIGSLGGYGEALRGKLGFLNEEEVTNRFLTRQNRSEEIQRLKDELNNNPGITSGLQSKLNEAQKSLQKQSENNGLKLDIKLSADKDGIVKAVINSIGFSKTVSSALGSALEAEATGVNR